MLWTHLSAGDGQLNLTTGSGDDGVELFANAAKETKTVVLGEGLEEVLDGSAARAGLLDELGDNLLLVVGAEGRGTQDASELGILLDDVSEGSDSLSGRVEGRRLGSGGVLDKINAVS